MSRYPIALLGAGGAGYDYLKNLRRDHRLEIVGFAEKESSRRREVEQTFGVPGFDSLDGLLAQVRRRPEAAIVAADNHAHKDLSLQCLEAGLHVFCEKPMATNMLDAAAMVEAETRCGRYLQIGFEYRYGTLTGRISELLDEGYFGELKHLTIADSRGHWLTDPEIEPPAAPKLDAKRVGGPIIHCGIHHLDLLRRWGGEVEALQAFVSPQSVPWYPKHCPDQCTIMVKFQSGASGTYHLYHSLASTWYNAMPPWLPEYLKVPGHFFDILLTGSRGCAIANVYAENLHLACYDKAVRDTVFARTENFGHHHRDASHHNMAKMALDFCLRMRDGLGPLHSAADSLQTTKLGFITQEAVDQAIASGWSSREIALHEAGYLRSLSADGAKA